MSHPQLAHGIEQDERARVPLQCFAGAVSMTLAWVLAWKFIAPVFGVQMLGFGELLTAAIAGPSLLPFAGAGSVQAAMELLVVTWFWLFPLLAGWFAILTVISTCWYGVQRWQRSSPPQSGGEP